jgi:hypothetical protein
MIRRQQAVAIEKMEVRRRRMTHAFVAAARRVKSLMRMRDKPHRKRSRLCESLHHPRGFIGRAVIAHDHFQAPIRLLAGDR